MAQTVGTHSAPAAPDARRGSHSWHDADYVREWVADNEARIESRRAQFDLIADFIPHRSDAAISILDVGAGWGPVTRHLLTRFPNARATLFDYSDQMFGEARAALARAGMTDRVWFVKGDLSQAGALDGALREAGGTFDAIVSSSCIHNVKPTERTPLLYQELRAATAPGGCFLNMDMVGTSGDAVQEAWRHARVEQYRRRTQAETGTLPSWDQAVAAMEEERRARAERHAGHAPPEPAQPTFATSGGRSRTLSDHLAWLRDAGFDAAECFWRQENRALIGGYVNR